MLVGDRGFPFARDAQVNLDLIAEVDRTKELATGRETRKADAPRVLPAHAGLHAAATTFRPVFHVVNLGTVNFAVAPDLAL